MHKQRVSNLATARSKRGLERGWRRSESTCSSQPEGFAPRLPFLAKGRAPLMRKHAHTLDARQPRILRFSPGEAAQGDAARRDFMKAMPRLAQALPAGLAFPS